MTGIPDAEIGALIAGLFALIGLIISKELKVSEFRQAWIDALRLDITSLVAHLYLVDAFPPMENIAPHERYQKASSDFKGLVSAMTRVKLRVNREDDKAILDIIKKLESGLTEEHFPFRNLSVTDIERELIDVSQQLLKKEWNRVRRGETMFFYSKAVGLTVLALAYIWSLCHAWIPGFNL